MNSARRQDCFGGGKNVWFFFSAGQRFIVINRIQNESFYVHNICVYCVYLLCIYKESHTAYI